MGLSPQDALAALNDVEAADARSRASQANRAGAPYLLMWGAIWAVGYTLTGLLQGDQSSRTIGYMWMALGLGGVAATFLLPQLTNARTKGRGKSMALMFLAYWAFIIATYWIMQPTHGAQYQVYPALIVAVIYMHMGSLRQTRILWVGVALFVLTLIGYAVLRPVLPFWLAAVGGGGLILGGLWMRQP